MDVTKTHPQLTRNIERSAYFRFPAGTYTVAVFDGGNYDLVKTFNFTINKKENSGEASYQINLEKKEFAYEESVKFSVDGENFDSTAWVGVYLQSDTYGDGGVKSILWYYLQEGNHKTIDLRDLSKSSFITKGDRDAYIGFPQGNYVIYVFADDGYNAVAFDTFSILAPEGEQSYKINLNKTAFQADESILLSVEAKNYDPTAWVGIYLQDDTYGANVGVESIVWYYLRNGNQKTVDLRNYDSSDFMVKSKSRGAYQTFPQGNYIVYIFEDEGYNVVESATFTITGGEAPMLDPFVKTDKESYKLGESVMVTAGNGNWVGVYAENELPAPGVSRSWYYVYQANQIAINIMDAALIGNQGTFSYKEGNYKVYLFADEGYSNILAEADFTIAGQLEIDSADYTLEIESNSIMYNSPVNVTASGTGTDGKAWVGLFKAEDDPNEVSSYYWYYVSDYDGQTVDILKTTQGKEEELEPGDYKLVLFANYTHTLPVTSLIKTVSIVKEIKSEEILSAPTCENSGLKRVTYKDGTVSIVEMPALGGPHEVNDDGFDIIKEPTCTESGLKQGTCKICGTKFTVDAEAYGHLYSGAFFGNGDGTHSRLCVRKGCDASETKNCLYGSDDMVYGGGIYRTCSECDATTIYSFSAPSKYADKIVVSYNGSKYAGEYEIKLYNSKGTVLATRKGKNATETFSSLTAGTYYKVMARVANNCDGLVKNSPWVTIVSPTLPKASSLSKLTAGTKKVEVQYAKVSGVTGYQVEYSKNADFSASKKATIKSGTTVKTTISSLAYNTKYYFRVRTYKTIDGKNYFSSWSTKKSITVKPVIAASKISSVKAAKSAFTVKWAKASVTGYQVQYATNAKFRKVKNAKTLNLTVKKLKAKTTYYVRVRTYKTISKVNYFSAWTAAKTIKTK